MYLSRPLDVWFEAALQYRGGYWHLQVPFQVARYEPSGVLSPLPDFVLLK